MRSRTWRRNQRQWISSRKVKEEPTKVPTAAALAAPGRPADSKGKKPKRNTKCLLCTEKHRVTDCSVSPEDTMKMVREHHRCVKCLAKEHSGKDYRSDQVYRKSKKPHHAVLRRPNESVQTSAKLQGMRTQQQAAKNENSTQAAKPLEATFLSATAATNALEELAVELFYGICEITDNFSGETA